MSKNEDIEVQVTKQRDTCYERQLIARKYIKELEWTDKYAATSKYCNIFP
jgi:hypothetical protein